jgi:hypothetical protein
MSTKTDPGMIAGVAKDELVALPMCLLSHPNRVLRLRALEWEGVGDLP